MPQRLADARAGLGWLADRCPDLPLIVLGHSEGTYYAAQLASENDGVAGVVLLSGSVRPGGEVLTYQTEQLADRIPASAKLILRLMRTDVGAKPAQEPGQDHVFVGRHHPGAGDAG